MSQPAASSATTAPARRHNLSRLLTLVHREGALSRAALTRRTGLNRSTIARSGDRAGRARAGVRDRPHRPRRGRSTESAGHGRGVRGRAHGQPGHRRGDRRSGRSGRRGAQADPLPRARLAPTATEAVNLVAALVDGMRSELDTRFRVLGIGVAVPGLVERSTGTVTLAPHLRLARRAAGRPDRGGDRLPLRGVQRRPSRPDRRAVVRRGPGPAPTSSTSTAAPAGSAAAWSAAASRCSVGTGTPASSATRWSTRPAGVCHCGRTGCLETEVTRAGLLDVLGLDDVAAESLGTVLDAAIAAGSPRVIAEVERQLGWLAQALAQHGQRARPGGGGAGRVPGRPGRPRPDRRSRTGSGRRDSPPSAPASRSSRPSWAPTCWPSASAELVFADLLADPQSHPPRLLSHSAGCSTRGVLAIPRALRECVRASIDSRGYIPRGVGIGVPVNVSEGGEPGRRSA